jgi:hypothetical protein
MANVENVPTAPVVSASPRRPPWFLLGVLLFLLGPIIYAVQFNMKRLTTPWYVPILATVGVLFMILSVRRRRGILRISGLVLFVLFCGYEWFTMLVTTRVPAYTGPAQSGQPIPAFTATLANGRPFTATDLRNGTPTVLLFFRGHW